MKFLLIFLLTFFTLSIEVNLKTTTLSANSSNNYIQANEIVCLAKNIYFEAAVESTAGKLAVAQVTRNRVLSKKYPDTYCNVVMQGKHTRTGFPIRNMCQFSWYCDGKHDKPFEGEQWAASLRIAFAIYDDVTLSIPDITDGSLFYHADYVRPKWSKYKHKIVKIDRHIFYR